MRAPSVRYSICSALERRLRGYRSRAAEDELLAMDNGSLIPVLSGGRKRRRRHHVLAPPLWLMAAGLASFVAVALALVRI